MISKGFNGSVSIYIGIAVNTAVRAGVVGANVNKQRAVKSFGNHDKDSAFLGFSKSQSDE